MQGTRSYSLCINITPHGKHVQKVSVLPTSVRQYGLGLKERSFYYFIQMNESLHVSSSHKHDVPRTGVSS